jgi:Ca2+-binding EF-hand superfamily protein
VSDLHASLDRNGDHKLTTEEASAPVLAGLVRMATGAPPAEGSNFAPAADDGAISIEALTQALSNVLGPARLRTDRPGAGRADALFDQLDRDKDGHLTTAETSAIAGALRKLDLDDDEMISALELEPFRDPSAMQAAQAAQPNRATMAAQPTVIEIARGESTMRLSRQLMRKYDKGRSDGQGVPDSRLSRTEFAILEPSFAGADANADGSLNLDEVRQLLDKEPCDITIDVRFDTDDSNGCTVGVAADQTRAGEIEVMPLGERALEIAVSDVRVDIRLDAAAVAVGAAQSAADRRVRSADKNKDAYLEEKEFSDTNGAMGAFTGLFAALDRDGDGRLYPDEAREFVTRQAELARARVTLTATDHGRAIFGVVDQDRDRRLGAREVMRTVARVSTWDADKDGRVAVEEIPYHYQLWIARGRLVGLDDSQTASGAPSTPDSGHPGAGPPWYRKMDRNRDGDISRKEFLGSRAQFDRLDRDGDGLIDAAEAEAAGGPSQSSH